MKRTYWRQLSHDGGSDGRWAHTVIIREVHQRVNHRVADPVVHIACAPKRFTAKILQTHVQSALTQLVDEAIDDRLQAI